MPSVQLRVFDCKQLTESEGSQVLPPLPPHPLVAANALKSHHPIINPIMWAPRQFATSSLNQAPNALPVEMRLHVN